MSTPQELLYTKDHEWVRIEGDIAIIGITDFAQGELGDVVFVQLPEAGLKTEQGKSFGSIEAVKAVADIYSPLSGEIVEANQALVDKPELINQDPYKGGWIAKIKVSNFSSEKTNLMNTSEYQKFTSAH